MAEPRGQGPGVKAKRSRGETARKPGRRRTRIGARAFLFFAVAAITVGALAISLNVRLEQAWNSHAGGQDRP
jgi:hypothetical protein